MKSGKSLAGVVGNESAVERQACHITYNFIEIVIGARALCEENIFAQSNIPPSTLYTLPVTYPLSLPSNQAITSATSSG